jgi:hypothetical protein
MTSSGLVVTRAMVRVPIALIALGAAAFVLGLILDAERAWLNLLIDGFYVMSLGVSAIFFVTTQRLSSARWSAPIRRIPEAVMLVLPAAAVLMVVLWFGIPSLYPWIDPHALHHAPTPFTPGKVTYLTPAFVYARMAAVLILWTLFALAMRRTSLAADADRDAGLRGHRRLNRRAAVFAPLFALTITTAAYDWLISLEPAWFSTMFAVYVFAGCFVQGIAAIGLATVWLKRRGSFGPSSPVGIEPVHTLGTMLLAFCTFWAYIWVCQYLLIWYGNIPEEVTYYLRRTSGAWLPVFLLSFVINWIIPFFALLSRRAKRSLRTMTAVCALVLFGRWLDLYVLVMPSHWTAPRFGLLEIAMAAGCAGLVYLIVVRALARAPLVPTHDPVLAARFSEGGPP